MPPGSRHFVTSAETPTHPAGQDTERSLVDVHDGIVLPFVAIHLLRQSTGHSQKRDTATPFPLALSQDEVPTWVNTSLSCVPEHSLPASQSRPKLLCLWTGSTQT